MAKADCLFMGDELLLHDALVERTCPGVTKRVAVLIEVVILLMVVMVPWTAIHFVALEAHPYSNKAFPLQTEWLCPALLFSLPKTFTNRNTRVEKGRIEIRHQDL